MKKDVYYGELNDVESIMSNVFMIGILEYEYDKVPFEKYVWTKFRFELASYFFSKNKLMKNSESSLDEKIEGGFDIRIDYSYDLKIDYGYIKKMLGKVQATILDLKKKNLNKKTKILKKI